MANKVPHVWLHQHLHRHLAAQGRQIRGRSAYRIQSCGVTREAIIRCLPQRWALCTS